MPGLREADKLVVMHAHDRSPTTAARQGLKRLGAIRVLYYAADRHRAGALANLMREEGLRGVDAVHAADTVADAIVRDPPHLLMLDMDGEDGGLVRLMLRLRRARLGGDPFLAAIACRSAVTADLARRYAAAGFDQILNKPFPADAVVTNIQTLAAAPGRRFVATKGYVGPDRRFKLRDIAQDNTIDVPNRLKAILEGAPLDREAYLARVAAWRSMLSNITME